MRFFKIFQDFQDFSRFFILSKEFSKDFCKFVLYWGGGVISGIFLDF